MNRRPALVLSTILAGTIAAACGAVVHAPNTPAATAPTDDAVRSALTGRREQILEWLHDYRLAGQYPTDEHGLPIGVFRDAHGVRCPMSELIYRSGRPDLVDQVVAENNKLRLADVHAGPLLAWMAESGLTREEIIEIQGALEFEYVMVPDDNGEASLRMVQRPRLPAGALGELAFTDTTGSINGVRTAARAIVGARLAETEAKLRAQRETSTSTALGRLTPSGRAHVVAPPIRVAAP